MKKILAAILLSTASVAGAHAATHLVTDAASLETVFADTNTQTRLVSGDVVSLAPGLYGNYRIRQITSLASCNALVRVQVCIPIGVNGLTITSTNKTNKAEFSSIATISYLDSNGVATAPVTGLILDSLKFNDTRVVCNNITPVANPHLPDNPPYNRLKSTAALSLNYSSGGAITNSEITNSAQAQPAAAACASSTGNPGFLNVANGLYLTSSQNISITNNKFHHALNTLGIFSAPVPLTATSYSNSSNGITITGNEFVHVFSNALSVKGVSNLMISGNFFHDFDTVDNSQATEASQLIHPDTIQFDPTPTSFQNADLSYTATSQLFRHDHVTIQDNIFIKSNRGVGAQGIFTNYNCDACKLISLPSGYTPPASYPYVPTYMDFFTITNNLIFQYLGNGISLSNLADSTITSNTVIRETDASSDANPPYPAQNPKYFVSIVVGATPVSPSPNTVINTTFTRNVSDNLLYQGTFANSSNLKPAGSNVTDHYPTTQPTIDQLFRDWPISTITNATTVKNVTDNLTAKSGSQILALPSVTGFMPNAVTGKWSTFTVVAP